MSLTASLTVSLTESLTASLTLLTQLLTAINNDDTIRIINNKYDPTHPLVNAAQYLANYCLTGDDGFDAIYELKKKEVHIYPLEQDRFGWLIGAIELDRGIIVFG
jgi:hypothetical protein